MSLQVWNYQFDGNPRLTLFQFTPQQTASLGFPREASLWGGSLTTDHPLSSHGET